MSRLLVLSTVVAWVGATLVLSTLRWFRRPVLADRLAPYSPGAGANPESRPALTARSLRVVLAPLVDGVVARLSSVLGVSDELATRLRRVHAPTTVAAFRARQLGWALASAGLAAVAVVVTTMPPIPALLFLLGGPVLAVLVLEQQMVAASVSWQRHVFLELPVVSEQLGMLLSAGYSLGAALNRLAERGQGCCARDLAEVCGRVRQGINEIDALREWAALVDVGALDRLVGVLALNRDGGDLGRLIAEESRTLRREVQRELIEAVERRGQQVWIPVTVATLVPGVLFLTVPFVEAMRLFTAT